MAKKTASRLEQDVRTALSTYVRKRTSRDRQSSVDVKKNHDDMVAAAWKALRSAVDDLRN